MVFLDTPPVGPPAAARAQRHLRPRTTGARQPTTAIELFFDLVYVFAVTQLADLILGDLTLGGLATATFLLLVVWWAWIYTTWMANWFDPASPHVRAVLTAVMLCSLLLAAALPGALTDHGMLFAGSYVALQVGRNIAAASLLARGHPLREIFGRLVVWSAVSGALWLLGGALEPDDRLPLWGAALAVDLVAPLAGYWLPGRGRAATSDYDIEMGHFAERCQGFIFIAIGESIVVTGSTAAAAGLTTTVVLCLVVAFVEAAALWWLYFGAGPAAPRVADTTASHPGSLARDAYTYLQLPIVAGIIATAVGDELLILHPHQHVHGVALVVILGGPALYLAADCAFRRRLSGRTNTRRLATAAVLLLLAPFAGEASVLMLSVLVAALLATLLAWELRIPA
jgi:low temperature requirement protein LtrA